MVHVQMHALGAFPENLLAHAHGFLDDAGNVREVGRHAVGYAKDLLYDHFWVNGLCIVQALQKDVLFKKGLTHLGAHKVGIGQIACAQANAADLVLVAGTNAAAGGANLASGLVGFPRLIKSHMVGQDKMGFVADTEAPRGNIHAVFRQTVRFLQEDKGVQHNTVANEAGFAFMENARGNGVQNGLLAIDGNGVPGIVAALKTHNNITCGSEHVDDLALAFIPPLGANNNSICHCSTLLKKTAMRA